MHAALRLVEPRPDGVRCAARFGELQEARAWRYTLRRQWAEGEVLRVVMLNPSSADETTDDNTIKSLIRLCRREGFAGCTVVNLFAFIATDAAELWAAAEWAREGPDNREHLAHELTPGLTVLVAWGSFSKLSGPELHDVRAWAGEVVQTLQADGCRVVCVGVNADGEPRHPCRIPNSSTLSEYTR